MLQYTNYDIKTLIYKTFNFYFQLNFNNRFQQHHHKPTSDNFINYRITQPK